MTKEEKHKLLGEYYVSLSCTNKNKFIDVINKFINLLPNFKPILENKIVDPRILKYVESNNLRLLRTDLFSVDLHHTIHDSYYYGNKIAIVVDEKNIKKLILTRNNSIEASELSNRLGIKTIRKVYENFVYNVITPNRIIRELKEIKTFFETITYPYLVKINKNNFNKEEIFIFYDGKFDIDTRTLTSIVSHYSFNAILGEVYFESNKIKETFHNLDYIRNNIMSQNNKTTKEKLENMCQEYFQIKIEKINANFKNIMESITSI